MSTQPRLEARVSAQERRQINLDARVEEIAEDISTNFKQISRDIEASFKQFTEYLAKIEEQTEERFNKIETDIIDVKTTLKQQTALLTQILERLPDKS